MPNRDGTGPDGKGPTGRRRGPCTDTTNNRETRTPINRPIRKRLNLRKRGNI